MAGVKGRGGRRPKPIARHAIENTFRSDRHSGIENPQAVMGRPRPPAKLGPIALREWRRMVALLEDARTLSRDVSSILYQYCKLFEDSEHLAAARIQRAKLLELMTTQLDELAGEARLDAIKQIAKLARLDDVGRNMQRQYGLALRLFLAELGQTPTSRSRVQALPRPRLEPARKRELTPLEKLQAAQRQLRGVGGHEPAG